MSRTSFNFSKRQNGITPLSNLRGYYKMEENSGNIVYDETGQNNGSHPNIQGLSEPGQVGNGFDFAGETFITVPGDDFKLSEAGINKKFSICFWIDNQTTYSAHISLETANHGVGGWKIHTWNPANVLAISIRDENNSYIIAIRQTMNYVLNNLNFIAFSFDPNTGERLLLLNDAIVINDNIGTVNTVISNAANTLKIGQSGIRLDELRIWTDEFITTEQYLNIYNSEK